MAAIGFQRFRYNNLQSASPTQEKESGADHNRILKNNTEKYLY